MSGIVAFLHWRGRELTVIDYSIQHVREPRAAS
jgi:hypothetical protein